MSDSLTSILAIHTLTKEDMSTEQEESTILYDVASYNVALYNTNSGGTENCEKINTQTKYTTRGGLTRAIKNTVKDYTGLWENIINKFKFVFIEEDWDSIKIKLQPVETATCILFDTIVLYSITKDITGKYWYRAEYVERLQSPYLDADQGKTIIEIAKVALPSRIMTS